MNDDLTNSDLLEIIEQKKRVAEIRMRGAKLNGDVKNIHKFCQALSISTSIYYDVVKKGLPLFSGEIAIKILENWWRLAEIKPATVQGQPDFEGMVRASASGKIN